MVKSRSKTAFIRKEGIKMKIVINKCYGGFGISAEAYKYMGVQYKSMCDPDFVYPINGDQEAFRTNEKLIEFIEKYGSERASGGCAKLKIVEIPKGTRHQITEYDGLEDIELASSVDLETAT